MLYTETVAGEEFQIGFTPEDIFLDYYLSTM